jgi:hypothetical protein
MTGDLLSRVMDLLPGLWQGICFQEPSSLLLG